MSRDATVFRGATYKIVKHVESNECIDWELRMKIVDPHYSGSCWVVVDVFRTYANTISWLEDWCEGEYKLID